MTSSKYGRLPQAGDLEKDKGTELFYLAPQPVPTGVKKLSSRNLHRETNTTYLDLPFWLISDLIHDVLHGQLS